MSEENAAKDGGPDDVGSEAARDAADEKIVQQAIDMLGEHFDCVQIFVTTKNSGYTETIATGIGNYYARIGIARDWIIREEERSRVRVRQQEEENAD